MALEPAVMLRIDRNKLLAEQPGAGHNRLHPHIKPRAVVDVEQVVAFETLDACDGVIWRAYTGAGPNHFPPGIVHPLTGPVYVKGAQPGDLLEVTILDIVPENYGFSNCDPSYGFLLNQPADAKLTVHWDIASGYATSKQLPGVRIPACMHLGVMAVAPSLELLQEVNEREKQWQAKGASVVLPGEPGAVPSDPAIAKDAWRTMSPHENGGNLDIKQLGKGARVLFPVYVEGALFSLGDVHFAQGDGEVCGTAIEIGATVYAKFALQKGAARKNNIHDLLFYREWEATPRKYFATTGQSHSATGQSKPDDLNAAARNALSNMIDHLVRDRGLTRQQAYILCSVAVDLKISQVVDNPNFTVTAMLPLDIFI